MWERTKEKKINGTSFVTVPFFSEGKHHSTAEGSPDQNRSVWGVDTCGPGWNKPKGPAVALPDSEHGLVLPGKLPLRHS